MTWFLYKLREIFSGEAEGKTLTVLLVGRMTNLHLSSADELMALMFLSVCFSHYRSSSAFQTTLSGASPGLGCGSASATRSPLPYIIKQENSMGYKVSSTGSRVNSTSQALFQNCRVGQGFGVPRDMTVGAPHVSNNGSGGVCAAGGVASRDAVQSFNNEDGSSPLALSPTGSRHSARLLSANSLKRHCLSLAAQSTAAAGTGSFAATSSPSGSGADSEEINITAIICSSSQMSMVACINGLRTNLSPSHTRSAGFSSSSSSSSTSPPSNSCSQEALQRPPPRGSPQQPTVQESCHLSSPATCLLSLSASSSTSSSSVSSVEPEQGQGLSQGLCEEPGSMLQGRGAGGAAGGGVGGSDGLGLLMSGALMSGTLHSGPEAGVLLDGGQRSGAALKQEPLDDFSPSEDELFQHHYHHHLSGRSGHLRHPHHPPRPAMPPPYHLHQYVGPSPGGLLHNLSQQTAPASSLGHKQTSGGAPGSHTAVEQEEAVGGVLGDKQVCRWIDCSAAYEQQEELVRHIEKVHIDQRKGEDFTCFWAGCIRRYKPFNARYKLLIHMRVHSGEKPNKCMVSHHEPVKWSTYHSPNTTVMYIHHTSFSSVENLLLISHLVFFTSFESFRLCLLFYFESSLSHNCSHLLKTLEWNIWAYFTEENRLCRFIFPP